ncbi:MAG: glycosyl transferase family 2 [Sphingomonas taxi]|uniref:Glycosyl transferase family 2 n=1 Tax=Sphingomonas taxi TaxID=1549858 RepID=A0A2W5P553_9SPHN|nr:MAG: glycosyl transferase family 2 [Sphingomonas taxi]
MQPDSVAVCVPVRDEDEALPTLLTALRGQQAAAGVELTFCFYLDGCRDGSEALLRAAAADFPHALHVVAGPRHAVANAGRARRAAFAIARERIAAADAVFLTTDADSRPASDWIVAGCRALHRADVAAGTLRRAEPHALQSRVEAYYDRLHRYRRAVDPVAWDPGDGRHFGGGANLAIRASTYDALGGFAERPSGEDAALLDEASRAGFRVRRDPAMVVETSSRRHGRAPAGLAAALADLDRNGLPEVAHPAAAAWQYRAQARARAAFAAIHDEAIRRQLGDFLGLSADHLLGVARECPNAEAFAMRVVPSPPGGERLVPLVEAEAALAHLERRMSEATA